MDLTRIAPTDRQHIQKYGPAGFTVSGVTFTGPTLVFAKASLCWSAKEVELLSFEDITPILERADGLDLCLLGCGSRMTMVAPEIRSALKNLGIALEPMDTGAACRTFNVLLAEGRAVAAALFPPRGT